MSYTLIKDYKHNEIYRKSFNQLAMDTFGIDFEPWYQQGFWNENYICYSFLQGERVVANVSMNKMNLTMAGKTQRAVQIGTVMTAPEHRRQGLALRLMKEIFKDYDDTYGLYFLAAEESAKDFYAKCGYVPFNEYKFTIDVRDYSRLETPLANSELTPEQLRTLKSSSLPLSGILSVQDDIHVLMFYYTMGFKDMLYKVEDEVIVIFSIEEEALHLFDILSTKVVKLEALISKITPQKVKEVICYFAPDQPVQGLTAEVDKTSNWMLRSLKGTQFPEYSRFPKISQT